MSKKPRLESLPHADARLSVPTTNVSESLSREARYTVAPGDILRLAHSNAYCKRGKYAILALDITVCLARTKKKGGQRRLTNRLVYVQITDLCHFKPTRQRVEPFTERLC